MRSLAEKFCLFVATGFGIGLFVPFAPGTFGSAPGVALAYALAHLGLAWQIVACLGFTLSAVAFCEVAEKSLGVKDDGRITADEWMLYPIALIGIPILELPWTAMAVFFAVIRFVDIVKPPPARQLQAFHGGFGIVIDDFFANLYSLAINWTIYLLFFK